MSRDHKLTRHARERSTERGIPPIIADLIVEFGTSYDAEGGARKYALSKQSMRELRRAGGPLLTETLARYRKRNAYVVAAGGTIITVAFATRPICA
jgi:hypothetical protein